MLHYASTRRILDDVTNERAAILAAAKPVIKEAWLPQAHSGFLDAPVAGDLLESLDVPDEVRRFAQAGEQYVQMIGHQRGQQHFECGRCAAVEDRHYSDGPIAVEDWCSGAGRDGDVVRVLPCVIETCNARAIDGALPHYVRPAELKLRSYVRSLADCGAAVR